MPPKTFTINETDEINTPSATYIFSSSSGSSAVPRRDVSSSRLEGDGGDGRVDIEVGYVWGWFPTFDVISSYSILDIG